MDGLTVPGEFVSDTVSVLRPLVNDRVVGCRRIFFQFAGSFDTASGPLELLTRDHGPVLFEAGADGDSLAVRNEQWIDPFEGKVTEENLEWIASHGTWTAVDVSGDLPWASLLNGTIDEFEVVHENAIGDIVTGTRIHIGGAILSALVRADDLVVEVQRPNQ